MVTSLSGKGRKGAQIDPSVEELAQHLGRRIATCPGFVDEVVLDDRVDTNAQKLQDARLCGFPYVAIASSHTLSNGTLEVLCRWEPSPESKQLGKVEFDAEKGTWTVMVPTAGHVVEEWLAAEQRHWQHASYQ